MKKHSQLKWLASLALGAGVLAAYGIHDAQAAYAALPADGTAGVVEQKEAQPLRWFTEKADAVGSSTPYGNNEKAGHYVQSGDARLYYEVYGKGTPVVVLHGGGVGTPYEMGCIIDELRKNHEVIVMSTRGHGRSEIGSFASDLQTERRRCPCCHGCSACEESNDRRFQRRRLFRV